LLRDLVAESFLPLDAVGFLECRHLEPTLRLFPPGNLGAAIGDETIHQSYVRASNLAFDHVGARRIAWHEEVGAESGVGAIGGESARGIARRRSRQLFCSELFRHRDGDRHSARLEGVGRIERFILDEELFHSESGAERLRVDQRRPSFAQRDDVVFAADGQHLAVAPQIRSTRVQCLPREELRDTLEIVAHEKRLPALGADVVEASRLIFAMTE